MTAQTKPLNVDLPVGAPSSLEAEKAVLGTIFIDPSAFIRLRAFLKPDSFFILRHNYIWRAMIELDDNKTPIDAITIADQLEKREVLDDIGGRAYLMELANSAGTSMYAEVYGKMIEKTAIRRQVLAITDEMRVNTLDEKTKIDEVINQTTARLLDISTSDSNADLVPLYDAVSAHHDAIEWRMKNPNAMIGIPTGFRNLDSILRGLQPSRFYLIASRPGMGKSAIMQNIAINQAQQDKRVAWFSFEMTKHELVTRFTSQLSKIDNRSIESGALLQDERKRYLAACGILSKLPINATDKSVTPMMIRAMCRKMKHTIGLDIVFIDYVQLIPGDDIFNNRYQEVGYVSRMLKEMAMELNIPVVAAAQLSRGVESRQDKRPLLSDLRESGNLEQDADVVTFLYSDDYYTEAKSNPFWTVEVITSKQRNGPTGHCKLGFNRPYTHFADLDQHSLI
jgi:replicative DNA helicase